MPRVNKASRAWKEGREITSTKDTDSFSALVKKLKLKPSQYAKSKKLVAWVKQFKNWRYVPEELLRELGLEADTTNGGRDTDWGVEDPAVTYYVNLESTKDAF